LSRCIVWVRAIAVRGIVGSVRFVADAWWKFVIRCRQCGRVSLESDAATAPRSLRNLSISYHHSYIIPYKILLMVNRTAQSGEYVEYGDV